ncbi:MAG TPA: hypothetical protein VF401_02490 [Candidatus Saccharimonadales bacterium]
MSRNQVHIQTGMYTSDLSFDDMYYELSHDWQRKARALQTRRWRALKREMRGGAL